MKVNGGISEGFKPVSVTITCDTEYEYKMMRQVTGSNHTVADKLSELGAIKQTDVVNVEEYLISIYNALGEEYKKNGN